MADGDERAVIGSSLVEPSSVFSSTARPSAPFSPGSKLCTTYGVTSSMLSVSFARSSMIAEARNSGRRWTMLTLPANFDRKMASSMAVSPPPTTIVSAPRKNAASQVAQ